MVYGIIELINFATVTCSCSSTIFAAFVIVTVFGVDDAELAGRGVVLHRADRGAWRRRRPERGSGAPGLPPATAAPKLAPLITAVGLSFVFQFVGQSTSNGSAQKTWDTVSGEFGIHDRRCPVNW